MRVSNCNQLATNIVTIDNSLIIIMLGLQINCFVTLYIFKILYFISLISNRSNWGIRSDTQTYPILNFTLMPGLPWFLFFRFSCIAQYHRLPLIVLLPRCDSQRIESLLLACSTARNTLETFHVISGFLPRHFFFAPVVCLFGVHRARGTPPPPPPSVVGCVLFKVPVAYFILAFPRLCRRHGHVPI